MRDHHDRLACGRAWIHIEELSTALEGEIDVQGLLGLDDAVPIGYQQIRIKMGFQEQPAENVRLGGTD
jgi:hypothetical protein